MPKTGATYYPELVEDYRRDWQGKVNAVLDANLLGLLSDEERDEELAQLLSKRVRP